MIRLPAERFTPRECEILHLIACDRSDKEIARVLGMSTHTLRTHLSRLYVRHGVHSRAAAVARWLVRSGAAPILLDALPICA